MKSHSNQGGLAPLSLSLPFPPSVNGLYFNLKHGGRVKTTRYQEWIKSASVALNSQNLGVSPYNPKFKEPVEVSYVVGRPDKRIRDLSNTLKALDDILVSYGILKDDSLIFKFTAEWGNVSGVFVTIRPYAINQ